MAQLPNNWQNRSIEALEKYSYGDPATAPTGLIRRCLEYVKVPISNLTIEQLRKLIGQQIGLVYLIPLALDELENDIMVQGNLYPGDLLEAVAKADLAFWKPEIELNSRLT
jgi:hypothetical protein